MRKIEVVVPANADEDDCLAAASESYIKEHPELSGPRPALDRRDARDRHAHGSSAGPVTSPRRSKRPVGRPPMAPEERRVRVEVRLSPAVFPLIDRIAADWDCTRTDVIEKAIDRLFLDWARGKARREKQEGRRD